MRACTSVPKIRTLKKLFHTIFFLFWNALKDTFAIFCVLYKDCAVISYKIYQRVG